MTDLVEGASGGVEQLAGAAVSTLDKAGPVGDLAKPIVDALHNVWQGYFGAPVPPGGTNWNAYTHEQMYQMLWQNADVGDVSSVAAEWGRHGSELTEHGQSLRKQRGTLQSNWSGEAADVAGNRLGELGEKTAKIGDRAEEIAIACLQDHVGHLLFRDGVADLDGVGKFVGVGVGQFRG